MKYRKLGSSGLWVSEISLGSWLTFGNGVEQDTCNHTVRLALDHGVNLLDTADVYARGAAEEALAQALVGVPRHRYVLASKCFFPMSDGPNDKGLSRKHVFESAHASLRRLRTDYLDLYQCHRFDPETPLEETIQAMDDLCRQGKILYWGISCWTGEQIAQAIEICDEECWQRPISNQPPYNLFERGIEAEVIPACESAGIGLVVFSPLAQGVLTGKYAPGRARPVESRAADQQRNMFMGRYLGEAQLAAAQQLRDVATELDVPLATFALAWCLRQPIVSSAIVGVTRPEQLEENLRASGLELSREVLARVDGILAGLPDLER